MSETYDAIVIGSGQAGPFLAVKLAGAGLRTVLIEREHLGGTCVNDGCMPTKTLVASARVAHLARRGADFGVLTGPVTIDMRAVKARKDAIVNTAVANLARWIGGTENLTLIWGEARFTGPCEVEVAGRRLTAPKVFINTGGRATVPDWPGLADVPYLTNTTILDLGVVPDHLIVVVGSYIGLEFAQVFRRFGAAVSVVEYGDHLIAREDREVSDAVRAMLEAEGIVIHTVVRGFAVAATEGGLRLTASAAGAPIAIDGSHLLFAVGRKPNTEALNLAAAGVKTDARGFITVDDALATSADGVWALGDANGRGAFTHTSFNDHEIVADNLLKGASRSLADRRTAYALFTDPPLGRVGMTEAEVRASGRPALVGVMPMTRVGRAKERGETTGFMKVLVDAETKLFLGAAFLCIEGDEIVHAILDAMYAGTPYTVLRDAVHIHPTVSELIPTLLQDLTPLA